MQSDQIERFLQKFNCGTYTEAEHLQFIDWLKTATMEEVEAIAEAYKILNEGNMVKTLPSNNLVENIEKALDQYELGVQKKMRPGKLIQLHKYWKVAAAAVIIIFVLAGANFIFNIQFQQPIVKAATKHILKNDAAPGGNKAILTLSNGAYIILDSAANGMLIQQGNTKIMKLDSGQLAYNLSNEKPGEVFYNIISTPRGGQYQIVLPDGSKVWLNAASSLKFRTTFVGVNREVELNGEAYFEVVKNNSMPFVVTVRQTKITVLGTHFNINAYSDEKSINTTLLEGSVKFNAGLQEELLHPGQQSQFNTKTTELTVQPVDVNQVVAWKNGFFEFDKTDLVTIMRQISRWYNVDISYQNIDNKSLFGGGISKKLNLSEVLHLLETNGVHFKIEDKIVIVL